MKVQEIRERFTAFFEKNGHKKLPSSSLIPHNDKTLLFANAGMNQFKDYFTGQETPNNRRVTTIQKCVRAGGKHNDLENVGLTARHHTFFEMLGNFSFGDYFKKNAIEMAWEFLTIELSIPKEKLYVTVHHSDQEALELWRDHIGVEENKIFKKGDKDNFWEMGDIGPCGPCSEIFYDHGEKYTTPNFKPDKKQGQDILDDEMRYVEVWNLVFMQFEKTSDGKHPLPNPSIDTGMGLERIAAVMQGKYWNYDTDAFTSIIDKIESISGKKYTDKKYTTSIRIIADHIRSSTMLITDGITPSNEGRGYVLRRIIRRAVRHARELDCAGDFLKQLVPTVLNTLKLEYPDNSEAQSLAEQFLELEEKKFLETLETGIKYLNQAIKNTDEKILNGATAFKLYDTYGFPIDLTQILLEEQGYQLDQKGFDKAMQEQKETSRKSWKGGFNEDKSEFFEAKEKYGKTQVTEQNNIETKLLDIISLKDLDAALFEKTSFYAEGGGQVGDQGTIESSEGKYIEILDTQKPVDGLIVHLVEKNHSLKINEKYKLNYHQKDRELIASNHSATHLLQAALINILGDHVKQSGSLVDKRRLRFDFTHMKALTVAELKKTEHLINEKISESLEVTASTMSIDQAKKKGAMALFGEKYGNQVRVLEMGDFSIELCGGSHVINTSQIGFFTILSESSLSTGVRRIEATTSTTALNYIKNRSELLKEVESLLNTNEKEIISKISSLQKDVKTLNKDLKKAENKSLMAKSDNLFAEQTIINNVIYCKSEAPSGSDLRVLSDHFFDKHPQGILLITAPSKDKFSVLLRSDKKGKFPCNKVLSDQLKKVSGRGGGKPEMAQGSAELTSMQQFLTSIDEAIQNQLS
jgi:alanyl-tRNA synthetase